MEIESCLKILKLMDALVKYFKLVSNIFEKFDGEIEKFSITSSVNMKPCTRSIFILEKYSY